MQNQRSKFSLPTGVTYLNCAYMSPLLKSVEIAGIEGIRAKRNPFSISTNDFFLQTELLRKEYAKLIRASDPKRIVVIPSASYGLANVASNVRLAGGDKIVVTSEQFPSNYYPWQRLELETGATLEAVAPPGEPQGRGKIWNQRILEAIDRRTRIVALGHVHWTDGTRFDLEQIRIRTREVGALLIVDGTQSVGALPFDVRRIQPDALICAGYKWLMGPYSIGLGYYGDCFDRGTPVEENWINRLHSENFARLVNYQSEYQAGALRYEVGEHSNFILVPMMLAALKQINRWKPENIQRYCEQITRKAIARLKETGYWVEEEAYRGYHLFGVRFPEGMSPDRVKERMKRRRIAVSFRGDSMRVSAHLYNDARDFERLVEALI